MNKMTTAQATEIVTAYEAGELRGAGAERQASEAVAVLDAARMASDIRAAYLTITGGELNKYIRLAAIRAELDGADRAAVDVGLKAMQAGGEAVLYPIDDPQNCGKADADAALMVCGERRDLLCIHP